jgi:hypothetical protein
VRITEAKVILSSSWRIDPIGLLAAKYYTLPFDDVCPDMPGAPRCDEVITWLRQHPEVTRYAVLDDEDDCLDELPLFQPTSRTGLTLEISKGIEEFLAGRSDKDMDTAVAASVGVRPSQDQKGLSVVSFMLPSPLFVISALRERRAGSMAQCLS